MSVTAAAAIQEGRTFKASLSLESSILTSHTPPKPIATVQSESSEMDLVACLFEDDDTVLPSAIKFLRSLAAQLRIPEDERLVHICIAKLEEVTQSISPGCCLFPFGSIQSGFGTRSSDLDITFVGHTGSTMPASLLLQQLLPGFENHEDFCIVEKRWAAKIPIIKLRFRCCLDIDLSYNNTDAIRNTMFLREFALSCPAVRDLVIAVKLWSKARNVNGATQGNLSSYSLTLMVIYFLQVDTDVISCPLNCNGRTRRLTLDLVQRFFQFYSVQFRWGSEVVCVRLGQRHNVDDRVFQQLSNRKHTRLHIEDPCLTSKNLNRVLTEIQEQRLHFEIASTYAKFCNVYRRASEARAYNRGVPIVCRDDAQGDHSVARNASNLEASREGCVSESTPCHSSNDTKNGASKGLRLKNQKLQRELKTSSTLEARKALFNAFRDIEVADKTSGQSGFLIRDIGNGGMCDTIPIDNPIVEIADSSSSLGTSHLHIGDHVLALLNGKWHAATLHQVSMDDFGSVEVMWESDCSISTLPASCIVSPANSPPDFVSHGKTPITKWPHTGDNTPSYS